MENINQNVAHIYCSKCDCYWQALNEDQNDWDEEQTAQTRRNHQRYLARTLQTTTKDI